MRVFASGSVSAASPDLRLPMPKDVGRGDGRNDPYTDRPSDQQGHPDDRWSERASEMCATGGQISLDDEHDSGTPHSCVIAAILEEGTIKMRICYAPTRLEGRIGRSAARGVCRANRRNSFKVRKGGAVPSS
jgi:hypothetical protein